MVEPIDRTGGEGKKKEMFQRKDPTTKGPTRKDPTRKEATNRKEKGLLEELWSCSLGERRTNEEVTL